MNLKIKSKNCLPFSVILIFLLTFTSSICFGEEKKEEKQVDNVAFQLNSGRELYRSGNWFTAQEAFQEAYQKAENHSPMKAEAAFELSGVLYDQGDFSAALKKVKEAETIALAKEMTEAIPQIELRRGHIEASLGQIGAASKSFGNCVERAVKLNNLDLAALCRIGKHFVKQLKGNTTLNHAAYKNDLERLKSSESPDLVGVSLVRIADLESGRGNYNGAMALLQNAQMQFEKSQNEPQKQRNAMRIAEVFQNLERWNDAAQLLNGLPVTFKNMNNRPALNTVYLLLARQKEHQGDGTGAYADFQTALKYAKQIAAPQTIAQTELAICEFFARTEDPARGLNACAKSRKTYQKMGFKPLEARALVSYSRLKHASKDYKGAEADYRTSLLLLERLPKNEGLNREILIQKVNLCQTAAINEAKDALALCQDALNSLEKDPKKNKDDVPMLIQTLVKLGTLEISNQLVKESEAHLEKAFTLAKTADNQAKLELINAFVALGQLKSESYQTAQNYIKRALSMLEGAELTKNAPETTLMVIALTGLGQLQLDHQKYNDAIPTLMRLAQLTAANEIWERAAWAQLGIAQAYQALNNEESSQQALKKGLPFAEKSKDKEMISDFKKYIKK